MLSWGEFSTKQISEAQANQDSLAKLINTCHLTNFCFSPEAASTLSPPHTSSYQSPLGVTTMPISKKDRVRFPPLPPPPFPNPNPNTPTPTTLSNAPPDPSRPAANRKEPTRPVPARPRNQTATPSNRRRRNSRHVIQPPTPNPLLFFFDLQRLG